MQVYVPNWKACNSPEGKVLMNLAECTRVMMAMINIYKTPTFGSEKCSRPYHPDRQISSKLGSLHSILMGDSLGKPGALSFFSSLSQSPALALSPNSRRYCCSRSQDKYKEKCEGKKRNNKIFNYNHSHCLLTQHKLVSGFINGCLRA